jgi:hypothetical protein
MRSVRNVDYEDASSDGVVGSGRSLPCALVQSGDAVIEEQTMDEAVATSNMSQKNAGRAWLRGD